MDTERKIGGLYPMLYAFWDEQGALDQNAMARQVDHVIEAGCDGIAVLGLVTESHRISLEARRSLMQDVGRMIAGRVPYSVTVTGDEVAEQVSFARESIDAGADWLILQPPHSYKLDEAGLIGFFAMVAAEVDCPLGVQNNPEHLKNSLSAEGLLALNREVPAITIAKAEGPVVTAEPLISGAQGRVLSFGGHGGVEHIRLLRAGAAGLIPAPDCLPMQVLLERLWREGSDQSRKDAEAIEAEILPLIVFMNRNIDVLLCYGRRFMARRLGLRDTHDMFGTLQPTAFGMQETDRLFERLTDTESRWLARTGNAD